MANRTQELLQVIFPNEKFRRCSRGRISIREAMTKMMISMNLKAMKMKKKRRVNIKIYINIIYVYISYF